MYKIMAWSDHIFLSKSSMNFYKISVMGSSTLTEIYPCSPWHNNDTFQIFMGYSSQKWIRACYSLNYSQALIYVYKKKSHSVVFSVHCSWISLMYYIDRDNFVYVRLQWGVTLHCNVFSHWFGAYTKWSLHIVRKVRHKLTFVMLNSFCETLKYTGIFYNVSSLRWHR